MTWPLAAFALLALALMGGALWYERTRPPAKVVALVATLGALAALGRIAFAPLPNVKPTTDIVLVAGIALGGAPAFIVGAVAALASNLFFGQGYWTPWQMLGWGMVGLGGAALGRMLGERVGRWTLAAAGVVAGYAFGAIMNFSTWVSFSDHSFNAYLAMSGSAFAFDTAHAVGNAVFALAFGPALLRAVRRFRARFEVRWRPAPAATTVAPLALVAVLLATAAAPPDADAATSVQYLRRAQNADGGWGGAPGQGSTALHTGWVTLGLAAAGHNPADVRRGGGRTALDFLRRNLGGVRDIGELERTIIVVGSAGRNPASFGGRNLVRELLRHRRGDGSFAGQVVYSSFAVLALRQAGRSANDAAVRGAASWIARQQNPDGGFNVFRRGGASGIDDTGAAVQALAAGGRRGSATVRAAIRFLRRHQNPDGGFPLQPGGPSNAQSTGYAAQAFVAAGIDPERVRRGGRGALGYIRSLTTASGAVNYSRTSRQTPVWVTGQAVLALAREAFPLSVAKRGRADDRSYGGPLGGTAGETGPGQRRRGDRGGRRRGSDRGGGPGAAARTNTLHLRWVLGAREAGLTAGMVFAAVAP